MRGESLFFVVGENGVPTSRLLFPPQDVPVLASADGTVTFLHGRDFSVHLQSGVITLASGSLIPFTTPEELYPPIRADEDAFIKRDAPETSLLFSDDVFDARQVTATYPHRPDAWEGYVPELPAGSLPRTRHLLREKAPLTICLTGDSISEGWNASGFMGRPPYQQAYGPLVVAGLEAACGSPVAFYNCAVAGWTADNAVEDADRLGAFGPDLVLIAFGMNDAGYCEPADFSESIATIIERVRLQSPNAEFVLVSSMLPNEEWEYPAMARFPAYRDRLASLCGSGIVLADMTALWTGLLARKRCLDLLGNGINHPNDFGHRLYAQVVLALLVGAEALAAAR
jgi:acyl-CoA thioesterase-1